MAKKSPKKPTKAKAAAKAKKSPAKHAFRRQSLRARDALGVFLAEYDRRSAPLGYTNRRARASHLPYKHSETV